MPKSRDQSPVRSTLSRPPVKAYAPRRGQSCRELLYFILFFFLCRSTKMLVLKPALICWFSNCWLFIQLRLNLSLTTVHLLLLLLQSGERGTGTAWTKPTNTSKFTRMISLKWPRFILLKYIYMCYYILNAVKTVWDIIFAFTLWADLCQESPPSPTPNPLLLLTTGLHPSPPPPLPHALAGRCRSQTLTPKVPHPHAEMALVWTVDTSTDISLSSSNKSTKITCTEIFKNRSHNLHQRHQLFW